MGEFFDYDQYSGIRTELEWDHANEQVAIKRYAEVEPVLKWTHQNRADGGLNKKAIDKCWWPYATIPPSVQLELLAKGLHVGRPGDTDAIITEINKNYPHLKMTTGKMGTKGKTYFV